ncbi:AI-2E family transporter [Paraferrimonas sp. SM1919]|uniref:AI-2E family transporter n=1 Tax=Paraferrimonas sp. SM1919 TaxID=2662263 RepID=UPI0013D08628|nr:AI-2E family transporter [Paraferrimonas sp. SM1919]
MFKVLKSWLQQHFSDPQAVTLLALLVMFALLIGFAGHILAPVLVALVLAFLLEWPVKQMTRCKIPRLAGASIVLFFFILLTLWVILGLIPSIFEQGVSLATELPKIIDKGNAYLLTLVEAYPQYISESQVANLLQRLRDFLAPEQIIDYSASILGWSANLLVLMVYMILIPLMLFFFLKDKTQLLNSAKRFLPAKNAVAQQVWLEMEQQIFNYIRGKVIEIAIVGTTSYLVFALMDLRYAALLGVLTGLSVLIPYIGATLVTIPIALVGFFQWGISSELGYLMLAYGIIQAIDGNLLVPLLFSEAVDLHPVVIIIAVLIFGGLWGVWGAFFAIPLASLVRAILNAWPTASPQAAQVE